ncbi:MAG: hypothetical protein EBR90_03935 [Actinobacteria bacterium]|nr:hypothetical protein [Actinomycetota bacterium]
MYERTTASLVFSLLIDIVTKVIGAKNLDCEICKRFAKKFQILIQKDKFLVIHSIFLLFPLKFTEIYRKMWKNKVVRPAGNKALMV